MDDKDNKNKGFPIFIDNTKFEVDSPTVTGDFLRGLPPVPADYDLWKRSEGHEDDIRIEPGKSYEIKAGDHFYTSKSEVGPGVK